MTGPVQAMRGQRDDLRSQDAQRVGMWCRPRGAIHQPPHPRRRSGCRHWHRLTLDPCSRARRPPSRPLARRCTISIDYTASCGILGCPSGLREGVACLATTSLRPSSDGPNLIAATLDWTVTFQSPLTISHGSRERQELDERGLQAIGKGRPCVRSSPTRHLSLRVIGEPVSQRSKSSRSR